MKKVSTCLEGEAAGVGQASDLLGASVGRYAGWEETGGITDPIDGWSASVIPEEIRAGLRW